MIKTRRLKLAGYVDIIEKDRSALKILRGKPLGRYRSRCKDNIRMDLKEIDVNTRNWIDSAQDRDYWRALVNVALNLWFP